MRYILLLYLDPARAAQTSAEEAQAELGRYAEITEDLAAAGVLRGGEAFLPAETATGVTVSDGQPTIGPPPVAELELAGFFIVECDEQQAIDIAVRMPVAMHGTVEVRPLMDLSSPHPDRSG